ncbi:unnamed protein product [Soboliphyme baturini]|uniref:Transposase n=1 Tax=Soboliphyme baturini TaxID=241478 RepID=A0A183IN15_9BILA|nr:unnamed protein product [Soboliphyme baturini]
MFIGIDWTSAVGVTIPIGEKGNYPKVGSEKKDEPLTVEDDPRYRQVVANDRARTGVIEAVVLKECTTTAVRDNQVHASAPTTSGRWDATSEERLQHAGQPIMGDTEGVHTVKRGTELSVPEEKIFSMQAVASALCVKKSQEELKTEPTRCTEERETEAVRRR